MRVAPTGPRFWFAPTKSNIAYRDVNFVRKRTYRSRGFEKENWDVHYLDGTVEDVPLSDLWRSNGERIEHLAKVYGVRFR